MGLLAPLVVARKGVYTDLAKWAKARGHTHLRVDGEFMKVDPWPRLDRFKEAIQALDRYVDGERRAGRRPESRVYRARAQAAFAIGNYALAAQDYSRVLDGDDQEGTAADHAGRGWCHVMQEVWPLALRDFEETVRLAPGNGEGPIPKPGDLRGGQRCDVIGFDVIE